MMKKLTLITLLTIFSFGLSAQEEGYNIKLNIFLEGFKKSDNLTLSIGGQMYKLTTTEKELSSDIKLKEKTESGSVYFKKRVASFWFEEGEQNLYIYKENFSNASKLVGSKSEILSKKLLNASIEEKAEIVRNNSTNPVIHSFMAYKSQRLKQNEPLNELILLMPEWVQEYIKYDATFAKVDRKLVVKKGDPIFDFIAFTIDDKKFNTKELRGKYILLDFASTGCGYCWLNFPSLVPFSKDQNLQILTLAQDYHHKDWEIMANNYNVEFTWPVLWKAENKKEIFSRYGIKGWPYYVLVSPEGKILETTYSVNEKKLINMLKKYGLGL